MNTVTPSTDAEQANPPTDAESAIQYAATLLNGIADQMGPLSYRKKGHVVRVVAMFMEDLRSVGVKL
jgi:hypothetical protein